MKNKQLWMAAILMPLVSLTACDLLTGNATQGSLVCSCELRQKEIPYELGSKSASGGNLFGSSTADVPIKNKADIGAQFSVKIDCRTTKNSQTISSPKMYILPGEEYTFKLKPDAGWTEDWKCDNYRVEVNGGDECVLKQ